MKEGCQEEALRKEEEEEEEDSRGGQVRCGIAQEVVVGIKEKAGVHEDAKSTAKKKRKSGNRKVDGNAIGGR